MIIYRVVNWRNDRMKAARVLAVGAVAATGVVVGAHRLHGMQANMRRYSMPSVGVYDLVTRLFFRRRYAEIARAIALDAPAGATIVDLGSGTGEVLVRLASLADGLDLTGV